MAQENVKKDYNDFYKHGSTEEAENFIDLLSRTKEVKTKSPAIYNEYMSWCKKMGVIPVGAPKFRALLREHGYRLEANGGKVLYVNAEYTHSRVDATSKVAYLPGIKGGKNDENDLTEGTLCTYTEEPRLELPEGKIPFTADLTTNIEKEKEVKEDIEDIYRLTQIQMVELLQEAERREFERRMQKFEQLKEEIIESNFSNKEVLVKMEELL